MKWLYLIIVMLGMLFIEGCGPIPIPCAPSAMGIPGNMHPSNFAIVSLSPSLTWEYPSSSPSPYPYPSGVGDCAISGYDIFLAKFNDKYYDIGGSVSGASTNSFTPSSPLEPATIYFWEARAVSSAGPGPWSGKHAFVTGPICAVTSLSAPYAHSPTGTIGTLRPTFIWWGGFSHPASCTPEGYHFELSTDPAFGSTVESFDATVDPSSAWKGWTPGYDLLDCTNYFWRIAGRSGGSVGPYANQSFRIEVGACLTPANFISHTNGNCRIGPDPRYNRLAILNPGDTLPVTALHQTEDDTWYKVRLPNDVLCWAAGVTGLFEGDPEQVPESNDYPPLPSRPEPSQDEGGTQESGSQCPAGQNLYCNMDKYPPTCYCR